MATQNSMMMPEAVSDGSGMPGRIGGLGQRFLTSIARRTLQLARRLAVRILRGEQRPPSVLRNHTNLPLFLVIALGLSLVCNFALKQSSAQASRHLGLSASIAELRQQLVRNPEDGALHSQLGELYLQERNYRRAMFHFRESSRLTELYGD